MATRSKRLCVLNEVMAKVPPVNCKGLCWQSCGVIMLSDVEVLAIEAATGKPAMLDDITGALPAGVNSLAVDDELHCRYLSADHRCTVYMARPLICRLYGAVEIMDCGHGCGPKPPLDDQTARALLERARRI